MSTGRGGDGTETGGKREEVCRCRKKREAKKTKTKIHCPRRIEESDNEKEERGKKQTGR